MPIQKVLSGGQTGVDRAALDAARALSLAHGGWCPKDRRAEDGPIDARYALAETPTANPDQRTEWNVRDADATLVLAFGPLTGGTLQAARFAERYGKPWLAIDLQSESAPVAGRQIRRWLALTGCASLNVAGPRRSEAPAAYARAYEALRAGIGRQS
ncbi:MAG: putative molybdenum carrier protein [Caulobacterales bacterium]